MLLIVACSKNELPQTQKIDDTATVQFDQAIYCAALMGVYQQLVQQSVSPKIKSAIGFTLGHANNINHDHNLGKNTEQAFQRQTLKLYTQLDNNALNAQKADFESCVNEAKLYDLKTQIPALIEKAKAQAKQQ